MALLPMLLLFFIHPMQHTVSTASSFISPLTTYHLIAIVLKIKTKQSAKDILIAIFVSIPLTL